MWPKLGFVPVDEKPGRSQDGKLLTCWEHRLREDKQIDIFKEQMSDQAFRVAIDAQILFHFDAPDSDESLPSKALLADYLADQIVLSLTDEIFLEPSNVSRRSWVASSHLSRGDTSSRRKRRLSWRCVRRCRWCGIWIDEFRRRPAGDDCRCQCGARVRYRASRELELRGAMEAHWPRRATGVVAGSRPPYVASDRCDTPILGDPP